MVLLPSTCIFYHLLFILSGAVAQYQFFWFRIFSRLCINFQGQVYLEIYLLSSCFSPSFQPLRSIFFVHLKSYNFLRPMIVTPCGRVLYTKMLQIAWRSIYAIVGGSVRCTYCAHVRTDMQSLTNRSSSCGVRR